MWYFNGDPFTEVPKGMEGFVYLIINTTNNKKYIGKKNFWERRKDPKTGRRKTKESSWKDYFGSCDELKNDVKELGKDKFIRQILYVLLREDYYNTNISGNFYSSEKENIYSKVFVSTHQEQKEHH